MAVNLSGRQFQDPELLTHVAEALAGDGAPPEYLELEITEGYAMQDVKKAIETLRQLKALGVRIAIDDFGTGYSCSVISRSSRSTPSSSTARSCATSPRRATPRSRWGSSPSRTASIESHCRRSGDHFAVDVPARARL